MVTAPKRKLPIDRVQPTDCEGGWFYVNDGSISIIADTRQGKSMCTLTRNQLQAAMKLMRPKRRRK